MKRPYLWVSLFSGVTLFACEKETETGNLTGTWHLMHHYYSGVTDDTVTYTAGDVVYRFYEDKNLYIEAVNQEIQSRRWSLSEDGDSVFFDVGAPWALSNQSEDAFTAKFQPYIDAYSTYVFSRAE